MSNWNPLVNLSSRHPAFPFTAVKTLYDKVLGELILGETPRGFAYAKMVERGHKITVLEIAYWLERAKEVPATLYYPRIIGYSMEVLSCFSTSLLLLLRTQTLWTGKGRWTPSVKAVQIKVLRKRKAREELGFLHLLIIQCNSMMTERSEEKVLRNSTSFLLQKTLDQYFTRKQ